MICEVKPGQTIADFFIVRKKELRTKHDREFYLSLELGDSSGRIFASVWQDAEKWYNELAEGQAVKVQAKVIDWKGRPHLSVDRIRLVEERDHLDVHALLPAAKANVSEILQDIQKIINNIHNRYLLTLLHSFFDDPEFCDQYKKAPGGKLWHHCYQGGLAEHTLSVTKIVIMLCDLYPHLNKELLISGALLHDIGKVWEYDVKGFIDYSDEGRLHGHIAIGYNKLAEKIDRIDDFPQQVRHQLLHLILSHQGKYEQGSPVVPMTPEAMILYYADEMDSKMNALNRIYERDKEPGQKWSRYIRLLNRFIYFGDDQEPQQE